MSQTLIVNVKQCSTGFEGIIHLPNTAIKLANTNGSTIFATRGSLTQAVQRFSVAFGKKTEVAERNLAGSNLRQIAPQKKAAKKNTSNCNKKKVSSTKKSNT